MKKITQILTAIILAVFAMPAVAQTTYDVDDIRYTIVSSDDKTAGVFTLNNGGSDSKAPTTLYTDENGIPTGHNGTSAYFGDISVPSTVKIKIGNTEYEYTVTTLVKDDSYGTSKWGAGSFQYSGVTTVDLPATITDIQQAAFASCPFLKSINVDENNPVYFDSDGVVYKYNNDGTYTLVAVPGARTEITILPGTTVIANCAFDGCKNLETIVIPPTVTRIGVYAFANATPKNIICLADNPPVCDVVYQGNRVNAHPFTDLNTGTVIVTVPAESLNLYKQKDNTDAYDATEASGYYDGNPWAKLNLEGKQATVPTGLIDLKDTEDYTRATSYTVGTETEDAKGNKIKYTRATYLREFKNTNWQALYVPFVITYDDWKDKVEIAEITGIYENPEGSQIQFYVQGTILESGSTQPNTPYLVRAKAATAYTLFVDDKEVLYAAANNSKTLDTDNASYKFTGQYNARNLPKNVYTFAMSKGALCQPVNDAIRLGAYRWYLEITPKSENATVTFSFGRFDDVEGTTGLENVKVEIVDNDVYYDLSGRRVENPTKGIYIKNGKKVYVK